MDKRFWSFLSTMICVAGPAATVELHHIEVRRGTEGLTSMPLVVANTGMAPISCSAALAHWYSTVLAEIAPGTEATVPLWLDPKSGTITILNDKEENMPVEALYCGIAGRAYETRTVLVPDTPGSWTGTRKVACAADADRLRCGR
ncbi:MAG: hypothetical protein JNL61_19970 [Rhizobiaceae bacterium]|nr:hypothetical protein [Rhizobiaceae bacterium]